ncbi:lysogenic conversion protein [Kosakonia sp. SOY2]|uniref:lysogenic conversion protein n=1 Tax=Kosakonia sp. SOY2 TaxID=3014557 RepID=UPI0022ABC8BA|nr:lysogenic conversion protein [Kosakonia sp. SOY2]MCZ3383847.1 lysogenic conversion protein [Kosakonia sp. SOY2]
MTIRSTLQKINWEASSVILAMMLFIGNIIYTNYHDEAKTITEKNNIRTMFAYEISYNHSTLNFLDSTRKIGYDENAEHITGEPFATNLNFLGGTRLKIASNQTNEVYKAYFNELSKLDKEDITLIMDYYHEQSILMEGIKTTQQNMNNKSIDLDVAGFSLEQHFLNELNLSNIILKRYKHLLAQHPKNPEMKDDNH